MASQAITAHPAIDQEIEAVYHLYAHLAPTLDPQHGLGGRLLWTGELDAAGCRMVRAANIAGAASLAATADAGVARQAMREGAIDFVVNSLDEALRILKNEIRKHQPVAVGITLAAEAVAAEMLERGVQPDLLRPVAFGAAPGSAAFLAYGSHAVQEAALPADNKFVVVTLPGAAAQQDAWLLSQLPAEDHAAQRWLRLAPRYLGPQARRMRSLACDQATAARVAEHFALLSSC